MKYGKPCPYGFLVQSKRYGNSLTGFVVSVCQEKVSWVRSGGTGTRKANAYELTTPSRT
jgi:hypothetical protein